MTGASGSRGSTLMDILDRVLDKGIVIDATVRISLVGIDVLGVDAKVTVASFQTYLELKDDPRAYEAGLLAGAPPRAAQLKRLSGSLGEALTEPGPSLGGVSGSEPAMPGRAAHHEEPTDQEQL